MSSWLRARTALRKIEYCMAIESDEGAIEILDRWLERWLYHKAHCPVCGTKDDL